MLDARSFNSEKMQWLNAVSQAGAISPTAFRVAYRISDHLNKVSGEAWPSYETLAAQVDQSIKTVQRAVGQLKKAGWLTVKGSYKRSNCYRLAWPKGCVRSRAVRKSGDKSAPQSGQVCPGAWDADVPQSYLRNLPRTYLRRPGEASHAERPFSDRGRWEREIVDRFGRGAAELLEDMQHFNPSALDQLCRDQRDNCLTEGGYESARLGIVELKRRRRI